ncbi:T-cell surface glycoprotein CD5 [Trachinotus anak]|uniref:T-cell surface glycoprotein CD5 n=1 Tax=Trachinotus anak TaxID=443729 RepID=UPI0039F19F81
MDLRTVVTISALLLIISEIDVCLPHTSKDRVRTPVTENPVSAQNISSSTVCYCPNTAPSATTAPTSNPISSVPVMGFLTVRWHKCNGDLIIHQLNTSQPICHGSEVRNIWANVCENNRGCKGTPRWMEGDEASGYYISEGRAEQRTSCKTMTVKCTAVPTKVLPDTQGKLKAYKVVTALLCCVLLALFLIRFTKPTVKALQKRLSDRRQNRWIGPTQSHSVSYHRGKTTVKNNDGEKRLSYPALERLTVSDSREPSSNRNSDYNF